VRLATITSLDDAAREETARSALRQLYSAFLATRATDLDANQLAPRS
jgi:hypothetical protein